MLAPKPRVDFRNDTTKPTDKPISEKQARVLAAVHLKAVQAFFESKGHHSYSGIEVARVIDWYAKLLKEAE